MLGLLGGGRSGLAGAAASRGVASELAESVSMSDVRSGVKTFRVVTTLGGGRVYSGRRCDRHCFL
jgi:hypothetical protein